MKKIKMKKIRSSKIFILFGLIFVMFTACIFGFKTHAYTTNPDNDLVSNNLINFRDIQNNDDSTWTINDTSIRSSVSFVYGDNWTTSMIQVHYNYISNGNRDLKLFCIDNSLIEQAEYLFIWQFDTSDSNYHNFDIGLNLFDDEFYSDSNYGTYSNFSFIYCDLREYTRVNVNDVLITAYTTYNSPIDLYLRCSLIKIDTTNYGFNPNVFNPIDNQIYYADDDPTQNYQSGYQTGYNVGYNNGVQVGSNSVSDDYNNLAGQYGELQNDYDNALDRITSLENANQTLLRQVASLQNGYNLNSLMWSIGGTPFESFKQIWNVDLMGVNLSNLFLGLISALVLIWVIKHFLL